MSIVLLISISAAAYAFRLRWGSRSHFASVAPTFKDVAYARVSPAQKLDLYLPTNSAGPFPVVMMVHGGAFMFGDKSDGTGLAGLDRLVHSGYAVASINYRLSGEAKFPAQLFDCKAAVRFLRTNAGRYKLDPGKFAAFGASAGGTLVSLLGTTGGVPNLEGTELGNADQSSRVQAVIDWFGPIDFLKMDAQFAAAGRSENHSAADSPESRLVGAPIQSVPHLVAATNAANYITSQTPPFLIENGTADDHVPTVQSRDFAEALRAVLGKDKVTYILLRGAGHGGPPFETADNLKLITAFLDQNLKSGAAGQAAN